MDRKEPPRPSYFMGRSCPQQPPPPQSPLKAFSLYSFFQCINKILFFSLSSMYFMSVQQPPSIQADGWGHLYTEAHWRTLRNSHSFT